TTLSHPTALLLFLVAAVSFSLMMLSVRAQSRQPSWRGVGAPIGLALVLFVLLVAPYIAAQQVPNAHFFNTRLLALVALPFALLMIGLARACALLYGSRLATIVLSLCLVAYGFGQWANYVFLQARWAKLQGLGVQLKALAPEPTG